MAKKQSQHNILKRALFALALLVLLVYFYPHPQASHYKYEEGRPWNYAKLIAPFDVPIHPDSGTVKQALDSLNGAFLPVYRRVDINVDSVVRVITSRMDAAGDVVNGGITGLITNMLQPFDRTVNATLQEAYRNGVIADSLPRSLSQLSRERVRMADGRVLSEVSTAGYITVGALTRQLDSLARVSKCTRELQNAGLPELLQPNIVCDVAETERLYANDKSLITIDRGVIQRGQTIIDKGAIVTSQDYTNLRTYEEKLAENSGASDRSDLLLLLGQTLYVAVLLLIFMGYLYFFEPDVWNNMRAVIFFLAMIALFFLAGVLAETLAPGAILGVPMVIVPILALVFFNGRLAVWTSMILALLCAGVTTTFALEFLLIQFAGTAAAVFSLRDLTQRSQLLRASIFVAVGYVVAYLAMQLMMNGSFDDFAWRTLALLVLNALLATLTYVLMFVVERLFGFISNVTLVELADTNSPLLRSLSDECPGTFQHSLAVSTLAGDAARLIGANTLLVRAGAMYHDIGKMSNPIFFTENQHGVNPHDGLTPQRSAEIIISHVTEGLRRAEKNGIPGVLRDFISEHHGAGKAKYFYITACRQNPDAEIDPAPFTYPGPNPRTRETSLLMMADSVEAASRSLKEHTPKAISDLVDKIIDGQIAEGLHNDSPISFHDVGIIKRAFTKRLMTMYHSRISYPDAPDKSKPAAPAAAPSSAPAQ